MSGLQAATVTLEHVLRELYEARGRLDPKDVVDEARDPGSFLHDKFEWNNDEAGEQWRLQQARALIRSVRIERVIPPHSEPRYVRAFVHDPEADGYLATEDVAKLPDVRERVLEEMRRDLVRLQKKWELYKDTFEELAVDILLATAVEEQPEEKARPVRVQRKKG